MLNFENLDGFVIDLTNKETCKEWFESCFTLEKDESYDDLCIQIAIDFEDSEYNHDLSISTYDALQQFLEENTLKYMEMYNKGEF